MKDAKGHGSNPRGASGAPQSPTPGGFPVDKYGYRTAPPLGTSREDYQRMYQAEMARDMAGKFAGGAEVAARNAGTYPVTAHQGVPSVSTHPSNGGPLRGMGASTPSQQRQYERRSTGMKDAKGYGLNPRRSVREKVAIGKSVDARAGKRNIVHD